MKPAQINLNIWIMHDCMGCYTHAMKWTCEIFQSVRNNVHIISVSYRFGAYTGNTGVWYFIEYVPYHDLLPFYSLNILFHSNNMAAFFWFTFSSSPSLQAVAWLVKILKHFILNES